MMTKDQKVFEVNRLMESGLLSVALEEIREKIARQMLQTAPNASEKREELYAVCQAVNELKGFLQTYVNELSDRTGDTE